jgi:hypothetical protein
MPLCEINIIPFEVFDQQKQGDLFGALLQVPDRSGVLNQDLPSDCSASLSSINSVVIGCKEKTTSES